MSQPRRHSHFSQLAAQALKTPGRHLDGDGLYLEVEPSGAKRWLLRIAADGRRRDFGLGSFAKVPVKLARERAAEYRTQLAQGIDPVAQRRAKKPKPVPVVPTFESCALEVHRLRAAHMRNAKRRIQWWRQIEAYALPVMGTTPVDQITAADVMKALSPIWASKPETARRIRQRIGNILTWAKVNGHRSGDNPIDLIGDALPRQRRRPKHFTALPYGEVATFVRDLRAGKSDPMTKLAFEFLILTAVRTIEVRHARRSELDADLTLWTIPAFDATTGRGMKMEREHVVPLSPRAAAIVRAALALHPAGDLIFPDTDSGQAISENRFLNARDALGYHDRCTPHGFRSSFRDWVAEETTFSSEVADMALAHAIRDEAEAAYRRGKLLAKRRTMMDAWADYACSPPGPAA